LSLVYCLQNPPANEKQGLVPEEMSQTLTTLLSVFVSTSA